jgi:pyruvate dehydrogenase (quinone)
VRGTKADYHAVVRCDLFIMLGTYYPYSEFLPRECIVVQVDERARVIGRRTPIVGSVRPTVKALLARVKPKSDSDSSRSHNPPQIVERDAGQAVRSGAQQRPHSSAGGGAHGERPRQTRRGVRLNTLWSGNSIRQSGEHCIIGSFNNGAVGTALGQSNGIQALDRSRQVIALCGDGGFKMLIGEFLKAVQHNLPVKAVVYNNSSLGLIRLEAESMGCRPGKPWTSVIRTMSRWRVHAAPRASRRKSPAGYARRSHQELKADGPAIIDCVVPVDELPYIPHIYLEKVANGAKAKIREAIIAVTRG